jgi:hypothetical protein
MNWNKPNMKPAKVMRNPQYRIFCDFTPSGMIRLASLANERTGKENKPKRVSNRFIYKYLVLKIKAQK